MLELDKLDDEYHKKKVSNDDKTRLKTIALFHEYIIELIGKYVSGGKYNGKNNKT